MVTQNLTRILETRSLSQEWWLTLVILTLRRLKQEAVSNTYP